MNVMVDDFQHRKYSTDFSYQLDGITDVTITIPTNTSTQILYWYCYIPSWDFAIIHLRNCGTEKNYQSQINDWKHDYCYSMPLHEWDSSHNHFWCTDLHHSPSEFIRWSLNTYKYFRCISIIHQSSVVQWSFLPFIWKVDLSRSFGE